MKKLIEFSKSYWIHIILAAVSSGGIAITNVLVTHLLKKAIDYSLSGDNSHIIMLFILGLVIIMIGMISNYVCIYMTGYYSAHILCDIKAETELYIGKLRPDYVENHNYGDTLARMSNDLENIRGYMENYFKDCIYVPIMVVAFSIYLAWINSVLFVAAFVPLAVLVPLSVKIMKPIKARSKEYGKMLGETNNDIQELCDGIYMVKAYDIQENLSDKYESKLKSALDFSLHNDKIQYMAEPISYMIMYLPIVICFVLGGTMAIDGKLTLGSLVAYISLMGTLINPLVRAYQLFVNAKGAVASAERVFEILDSPIESGYAQVKEEDGVPIFELEHVTFGYQSLGTDAQSDCNVLDNINLVIRKNSKNALVGESGCGKSTLLKLLWRKYSLGKNEGIIRFCGQDINEIEPEAFRNRIALISQKSFLFAMSIKDNIRIGKTNATDEEIIEAAKVASCHTFIEELPEGYDTLAGEKGTLLSGGQIQRIAIARAVLKGCDVILLDEPTSALDHESERLVNEALGRICQDKTVITVAHRLQTIENVDEIIKMSKGSIVSRKNHIKKGGSTDAEC